MHTCVALVICVLCAFACQTATAAPQCNITVIPNEAAIRTTGQGIIRVAIGNADIPTAHNSSNPQTLLSLHSVSGLIVASTVIFSDQAPQFIQINLQRVSSYEIFQPDNVTFQLPSSFFLSQTVGCTNLTFEVRPSAGAVSLDTIPLAITEVNVNDANVTFPLNVSYDEFMSANVTWSVDRNESGFAVDFSLATPAPSRAIIVRIHKNTTFNLPRDEVMLLSIEFPTAIMRSGITPIIGEEIYSYTSVVITIQGSSPYIEVEYGSGASSLTSEELWDGTGNMTLNLKGDTWLPGAAAHWYNTTAGPHFEVSRPIQTYGFTFFLNSGLWPTAVFSLRKIFVTFPPRPGFVLITSPIESIDISNLNKMMFEQTEPECLSGCSVDDGCVCASFRILKANISSIRINFDSPVLANTTTESVVRRNGINITLDLKYDTFASSSSATMLKNIKAMFKPGLTTPLVLSLADVSYTISNFSARMLIVIPPQLDYNIDESVTETILLDFPKELSSTLSQLEDRKRQRYFKILPVPTPICTMPVYTLTEADIRDRDMYLNITVSRDQFCFSPTPTGNPLTSPDVAAFMQGIKTTYGGVIFQLYSFTANSAVLVIKRNYSYDISRYDIVSIPVPRTIMCSREYCKADPVPLEPPANTLTIPIREVAGTIIATFPQVTEVAMRSQLVRVTVELRGETFALSAFYPIWQINTRDWTRGFATSIRPNCQGLRLANVSRANITCQANASYDISYLETATVMFETTTVASDYAPLATAVTPLRVTPVVGTVIADDASRVITITEADIINGGTTITMRLLYERFNVENLTSAFVNSVKVNGSAPDDLGVTGSASSIFASSGFSFNKNEDELTLVFQPAPNYDLTETEVFVFYVSADAVASDMVPLNNNFTIIVTPTNGSFSVFGTATYASARQVLEEELVLNIRLHNDVWLPSADFIVRELCPLENLGVNDIATCIVYIDESNPEDKNRVLIVLFQPSETFSLYTNTTFALTIRPEYIRSGIVPPQPVTVFIYVSAGRITWSGPSVVTEDLVRNGAWSESDATLIKVAVGGDALADIAAVRSSLVASVTCVGSNDRYGFCGRAEYLFGDGLTLTGDSRRGLTIKLQSNEDFDVYEPQNVTLRLSGAGLVSRLSPNITESFTFRIIPTTGKYFLSGFTSVISERDISGVTLKTLQMVCTLYGERWVSNKTKLIPILLSSISSDAGSRESSGFTRYKPQIITAEGSTVSDSGRVMTIQFAPVAAFDISYDEKITIIVGADCVMSLMRPSLSSASNTFVIQATGGLITLSPRTATATIMRTVGALLTLSIDGDQWKTEVVQTPATILEAIRVGSSPQQEPSGFAVNLDTAVEDIRTTGSSINGTSLIITLLPMPNYDIIANEVITLYLVQGWTVSNLPLIPNEFAFTITPSYDSVEVVMSMAAYLILDSNGYPTNVTTFDIEAWKANVAKVLSVSVSAIVIEYFDLEYMLPAGAEPLLYRRIRFRVKNEATTSAAPFNNLAASNFVAYDSTFLLTKLSAVKAYLNSTPPSEDFWLSLKASTESDSAFFIPINRNIVWVFAALIVLVLAGVGGYLAWRTKRMLGGASRAREVDKSSSRKAVVAEDKVTEEKRFDRSIYSGQGDETTLDTAMYDDDEKVGGGYLTVPEVGTNGKPRMEEYELPMDLYSGQTHHRRPWDEPEPALLDEGYEPPAIPFPEVAEMEVELTAVYPPNTRPAQMFKAKRRYHDFL